MSSPPGVALLAGLVARPPFTQLDREAWSDVANELELVTVAPDEILVRAGDAADCLHVVQSGRLRLETAGESAVAPTIGELAPGDTIGDIAVLVGGVWPASVRALERSEIVRLPRAGFDRLLRRHPDAMGQLAREIVVRWRRAQLSARLAQLFGPLDDQVLRDLEAECCWISVRGGAVLFRQGDLADAAYVVIGGRLRVVVQKADGGERVLNEVGPGQLLGEMGVLTQEHRSATVYAIRDSELAMVPGAGFERLLDRHPRALMTVARTITTRLREQIGASAPVGQRTTSIAVIPASPLVPLAQFVTGLADALEGLGRTARLASGRVDSLLARSGISQRADDDPEAINLVAWLTQQEADHRFVVYQADQAWTSWTQRCVRQADHVLVVATAGSDPRLGEVETRLWERAGDIHAPPHTLVLLQADGVHQPSGTGRWLDARPTARHYHLRAGSPGGLHRLARILGGEAVGLVLGGGGARGLAHIGVVRALAEAGIRIDLVGGSSIGSILAGYVAAGVDHRTMLAEWKRCFTSLYDFTLPMVSLIRARRVNRGLVAGFGDTRIEDLWLPYFCVSSSLTTAEPVVHRRGLLRGAVGASVALPGVMPPVPLEGELLVDGALLNNLPVDVMQGLSGGGPIVAVDVNPRIDLAAGPHYRSELSGWRILWSRVSPFGQRIDVPGIFSLLARASLLGSIHSKKALKAAATADLHIEIELGEIGLTDFRSVDRIVTLGYEAAARQIEAWRRTPHAARLAPATPPDGRHPGAPDS